MGEYNKFNVKFIVFTHGKQYELRTRKTSCQIRITPLNLFGLQKKINTLPLVNKKDSSSIIPLVHTFSMNSHLDLITN